MDRLLILTLSSSCIGYINGQYNGFNPNGGGYPFSPPNGNNPMYGPPGPFPFPRNSGGPGSGNYGDYGSNGYGDRDQQSSTLDLAGLSGFYSALSNELVYAGNSPGSGASSGSAPSKTKVNQTTDSVPSKTSSDPQKKAISASSSAGVNLGDTSVLQQMGLQQLGSFFGSMVNELNNAGTSGGLNSQPTVVSDTSSDNAPSSTPQNLVSTSKSTV